MGSAIGAIFLGIISVTCFVFSYLQFHEKGFLFNNAYIYASKKERETMNKKPHYKQSGMVFLFIGILFLINTVDILVKTDWLLYLAIADAMVAIVYAIVSSIAIEKGEKKESNQ